jgi:hypothetical protein
LLLKFIGKEFFQETIVTIQVLGLHQEGKIGRTDQAIADFIGRYPG